MDQIEKEDKIKYAKEKKKEKEAKEKKKDKESKEKEAVVIDTDEEISDDGEFFLRDRPA
jgi:hypothetical protein